MSVVEAEDPGRGRRVTPPRPESLVVKLSTSERQHIREQAQAFGLSVSDLVRQRLTQDADHAPSRP